MIVSDNRCVLPSPRHAGRPLPGLKNLLAPLHSRLTQLPLRAAGLYNTRKSHPHVHDFVISLYIPFLSALLRSLESNCNNQAGRVAWSQGALSYCESPYRYCPPSCAFTWEHAYCSRERSCHSVLGARRARSASLVSRRHAHIVRLRACPQGVSRGLRVVLLCSRHRRTRMADRYDFASAYLVLRVNPGFVLPH